MASVNCEEWKTQGIDDLEPRAWDALREVKRNVLVTAGAGAGKTEFLAQKAAFLLQTGICRASHRILAISFKKDAARNLTERVMLRCSPDQARRFDSLTFDAFTKSMIDRFRKSIPDPWSPPMDYQIIMPKKADLDDFLSRHGFHQTNSKQLADDIALTDLPFPTNPIGDTKIAVAYWEECYHKQKLQLTFPMINRLIHWMLRENPKIKSALQKTYQFIFLDEFQDTTYAQFDLLNTAFLGGPTKFTAVGDDKQRIMAWAGAIPDAFDQFQHTYEARRISLLSNWRSHKDLVAIQHVIAQQIDPDVEFPQPRGEKLIDGAISAIWDFSNADSESESLAKWIQAEIKADTLQAHDVAILVRNYANDVEKNLSPAFATHGLKLRNLARELDGISIQDILSENLTGLLLPLLRLGSSKKSSKNWDLSQNNMNFLNGNDPNDYTAHNKDQKKLQEIVRSLRHQMCVQPPDSVSAKSIATTALNFWTKKFICQAFSEYRREQDFNRVWNGFLSLLVESTEKHNDWPVVLDEFEGHGQVPLMTIHKSKGLEFHTIIFCGLDNQTWRYLKPGNQEELNVFFVALTRAEQRAFFTLCKERGQAIGWLDNILLHAGVQHIDGSRLV